MKKEPSKSKIWFIVNDADVALACETLYRAKFTQIHVDPLAESLRLEQPRGSPPGMTRVRPAPGEEIVLKFLHEAGKAVGRKAIANALSKAGRSAQSTGNSLDALRKKGFAKNVGVGQWAITEAGVVYVTAAGE